MVVSSSEVQAIIIQVTLGIRLTFLSMVLMVDEVYSDSNLLFSPIVTLTYAWLHAGQNMKHFLKSEIRNFGTAAEKQD